MTEKQALQTIGVPIIQAFSDCWKKSWNDVRGPFHHPNYTSRIRSDLLREHAAIHGQNDLQDFGLKYLFDQGQHMFILPNKALFIFKKLDDGQRPHKGETDRSDRLFQSDLIEDMPTLIVGMQPHQNWTGYAGIFLCRPNLNGVGNSWALNIADGVADADANQTNFIDQIDESDSKPKQNPKKKWKPKYDPNIGESSEEAGSGGGTGG